MEAYVMFHTPKRRTIYTEVLKKRRDIIKENEITDLFFTIGHTHVKNA